MTGDQSSPVYFCPVPCSEKSDFNEMEFESLLKSTVAELSNDFSVEDNSSWAIKIPLSIAGQTGAVSSRWLQALQSGLQDDDRLVGPCFDNLSITTAGLETADGLIDRAKILDLQTNFVVGDDPGKSGGVSLSFSEECALPNIVLSTAAAEAGGLLILNSVRPHPHLGMSGALFALGCGIMDRDSKLLLHRDIRPTVDTPLCAGCGSCLASCIFDAIAIRAGRAFIDHKVCTGCGECMTACHLSGINAEDAARIPRFQTQVAEAGFAVATQSRAAQNNCLLYANILTPISRDDAGGFGRDHMQKSPQGVLIGVDPVALDQATWDLLIEGSNHGLRLWSGFLQEPEALMHRAEALGLGHRQYDLQIRT